MVVVATGAGVHAGDQHKVGREVYGDFSSADGYLALFQGLPHHLQYGALEFGELIQKQDPMMGQGNFSGLRITSSADQGYIRNGVVWAAKRSLCK